MKTYTNRIKRLPMFPEKEYSVQRILVIIVLLTAILPIAVLSQKTTNKTTQKSSIIPPPLVDHHQHLFSPAKAKVVYNPPLPTIELPKELAALIRERETAWNDKSALSALYTEDGLLLNTLDEDFPTWMRGRATIAEELTRYFDDPYRITPVAYRVDDSSGYVAGYYTRGEGDNIRHFGHVFLSLSKTSAGKWGIATETPTFPGPFVREPSTADQLIAQLDEAGIKRAVVLSVAYQWGSSSNLRPDEYTKVKAENDYIAQQVARYPNRLVGFCAFNPLKDYALDELERCQNILQLKGLKLHFGNSRVELRNPEHVEKIRRVFAAANKHRVPIVAHLWTLNKNYGREDAEVFLNKILPVAPDITIQIAHLAGGGNSNPPALTVYADAIAAGDRRTRNLYFDLATVTTGNTAESVRRDAILMRRIGFKRILYGTDTSPPHPPARTAWANFKGLMPLTDAEFRTIAGNVAPYLR
jgi:predicted TIM-barrel fold metal-dependent hydrolase